MATLSERAERPSLLQGGMLATAFGGGGTILGFVLEPRQALHSYLVAFSYVASISVGCLFLLLIGYATNAGWMSVLRRLLDTASLSTLPLALLFVPIVLGAEQLYVWARHDLTGADEALRHALEHKAAYLNVPAFTLRAVAELAIWIGAAVTLRRWSLRRSEPARDTEPSEALTRERRFSSVMLVPSAIAITFAAFDWLMSLDPTWFSSTFGIYYFAGGFLAAIALITLAASSVRGSPGMDGALTVHHFHALGRLLLAFTVFWAYIAYFQVFLIAIADRPVEVTFFVTRLSGTWRGFVTLLIAGHFALPFLLLLPRSPKMSPRYLAAVSGWLLIVHFVDVHWLVMPSLHPTQFTPHWLDLATLLAVGGVCATFCALAQRGRSLVAAHDPLLPEGIHYVSTQ